MSNIEILEMSISREEAGVFRFLHKWNYTIPKLEKEWSKTGWFLYTTLERCKEFLSKTR